MDDFSHYKDMLDEHDSQATPVLGMRIIRYLSDEGVSCYDIDFTTGFDTATYLGVLEWAKQKVASFAHEEGLL